MELRFEAMLYSYFGNENSDADHIQCSRGPQVPHPSSRSVLHNRRACRGTPVCCETMLDVPRNNFNRKSEHYSSLTQTLAWLLLCCFCDVWVDVFTTAW